MALSYEGALYPNLVLRPFFNFFLLFCAHVTSSWIITNWHIEKPEDKDWVVLWGADKNNEAPKSCCVDCSWWELGEKKHTQCTGGGRWGLQILAFTAMVKDVFSSLWVTFNPAYKSKTTAPKCIWNRKSKHTHHAGWLLSGVWIIIIDGLM